MTNRGLKINTLRGLFALSLLGITACVDNAYDLSKDVDMTITVGGENLSIPGSNTDLITLEKIFDLAPESDVKADANGNYALTMSGEGSESSVNVENVTIEGSEIETDPSTTELNFQYVPNQNAEADVDDYTSFNVNKTDVTEDVVSLDYANVTSMSSLDLTFDGSARQLHLSKDFTVTFPEYMTIRCDGDTRFQAEGNTITFTKDVHISRGSRLSIPVSVTAIDFKQMPDGEGLVERGHLVIRGDIPVKGQAYLLAEDFLTHQDVQLKLNTEINIGNIELTEVTAVVDPQIDITIDPVMVNELPDFLQDNEVEIDMTDPKIFLYVTNESPVAVNFSADMIPYKDGQAQHTVILGDKPNGTEPITIPANKTDYVICLHRLEDAAGIEADQIITVPDLNNLVAKIPDEIRTENIEATAVQTPITLELGRDYNVKTDYNVVAPLQFNDQTRIVYNDQMDDWNSDMEDIDARHAEISLTATNTIPLGMTMTADAIDPDGNVLNDITATVEGGISAGTPDAPTTSALTIRLESKADGALKNMDGIAYRVEASVPTEVQGITLNESQSLKLDNVIITVKGGVTVDLN
ncbi:hypothetical protein [Bacteroides gallinaceum]|uniref:hypothetical protein n=1 Tax=Bacteroides gallinaceum TaxID=1462571 RepID=UPI0025AA35EE|nr:hypothetical protein [Bacteroides gallinaceum]MDN0067438.1 hypothetical protein [Bacteroides gallinaceum]